MLWGATPSTESPEEDAELTDARSGSSGNGDEGRGSPAEAFPEKLILRQIQQLDEDEDRLQKLDSYGLRTGWQSFDEAIEGIQSGLYVLAGDSNIGKSAFTAAMAMRLLTHNQGKVSVLDLSLDDSRVDRIARILAARGRIPINAYRRPRRYADQPEILRIRDRLVKGLRKLMEKGRYAVYDTSMIAPDIDNIEKIIEQHILMVRTLHNDPDSLPPQVVVFVDALHDIEAPASLRDASDNARMQLAVKRLSEIATRYDVPIITTAELRKINGFRRPTSDDIRDTIKIRYEAKAIWLLYNELSLRGEEDAKIFWTEEGRRLPVLELTLSKNKFHSYKGRFFFLFRPDLVHIVEPSPEQVEQFRQILRRGSAV